MRRICQPWLFNCSSSFDCGCHVSCGPESHVASPVAKAEPEMLNTNAAAMAGRTFFMTRLLTCDAFDRAYISNIHCTEQGSQALRPRGWPARDEFGPARITATAPRRSTIVRMVGSVDTFAPASEAQVIRLIEEHPLAWVVSHGSDTFAATPLPLRAVVNAQGNIERLVGHFARSNPQVQALRHDPRALILF